MTLKRYKEAYENNRSIVDKLFYICLTVAIIDSIIHDAEHTLMFAVVLHPVFVFITIAAEFMLLPILSIASLVFDHKGKALKTFLVITLCLALAFQINGGMRLFYDNLSIFVLVCLMIAAKKKDFTKIAWIYVITSSVVISVITVLALTGVVPDLIFEEVGRPNRHSLGIQYPLNYIAHWLSIALVYCYQRRGILKRLDYVGLVMLTCVSLFVCKAQTSSIIFVVLIIGTLLRQLHPVFMSKKTIGIVKKCLQYSFLFFAVFMIVGSLLYAPPVSDVLSGNPMLGTFFSRFAFGRKGLIMYFPSLLGINYPVSTWIGTEAAPNYFFVDSSYIFALLHLGVPLYLITMAALVYIPHKVYKHVNGYALCLLALFACVCAMEHHLTDLSFNIFWLMTFAELTDASEGMTSHIKLSKINRS